MALDRIGLELAAPYVRCGAAVLCLGYPDITARPETVKALLDIAEVRVHTAFGRDHKVSWPLPETIDTLTLAGATAVDCVDSRPSRGCERKVDLNIRQEWPRRYGLVINPGTIEHCFNVATAMFNAWRAVDVGGVILHVAPMTMINHGFWNFCPTAIADFAKANGGRVIAMQARDREWNPVALEAVRRFRAPGETVLYALVQKRDDLPEQIPVQGRFGQ
jgi:hypothetical protein